MQLHLSADPAWTDETKTWHSQLHHSSTYQRLVDGFNNDRRTKVRVNRVNFRPCKDGDLLDALVEFRVQHSFPYAVVPWRIPYAVHIVALHGLVDFGLAHEVLAAFSGWAHDRAGVMDQISIESRLSLDTLSAVLMDGLWLDAAVGIKRLARQICRVWATEKKRPERLLHSVFETFNPSPEQVTYLNNLRVIKDVLDA